MKKEDNIDSLKSRLHLSLNTDNQDHENNKDKSPSSVKEVKDIILASSKSILGKVLSPTKEKFASREKVIILFLYFNKFQFVQIIENLLYIYSK